MNNNIIFLEITKKEIIRDECENIVVKESKIENVQGIQHLYLILNFPHFLSQYCQ